MSKKTLAAIALTSVLALAGINFFRNISDITPALEDSGNALKAILDYQDQPSYNIQNNYDTSSRPDER